MKINMISDNDNKEMISDDDCEEGNIPTRSLVK
jgi:hypothetical protein